MNFPPNFRVLAKIRHYVCLNTLIMIYHGIFSSILLYGSQIWGQINRPVLTLGKIQNKALRIMKFEHPRSPSNVLYNECKILKLDDSIKLSNYLFAHDNFKNNLPSVLCNSMYLVTNRHSLGTRNILQASFITPNTRTIVYGSNIIKSRSVDIWNSLNKLYHLKELYNQKRNFCKGFIKNRFIEGYI